MKSQVHCWKSTRALRDMNRILEKLRNMACKVKKKQCFTDYVSYLYT
jgi:hypothetical protein